MTRSFAVHSSQPDRAKASLARAIPRTPVLHGGRVSRVDDIENQARSGPGRTNGHLYGDPLPPGAISRLGTLRDNIGEISGDIVLSPDGKSVIATSASFSIPLRLWDVETGCVIVHLDVRGV